MDPGLGPSEAGPRLLRSLVLGTEVEIALGQRLVAALSHASSSGVSEAVDTGTEVRLALALSRQVRLLAQLRGLSLAPTLLVQYSSEGIPGGSRTGLTTG